MSSEGFLLRFLLGLGAGLCVVVLTTAWGLDRRSGAVLAAGQGGGSWATEAELAWLGKLGRWEQGLMRGLREATRVDGNATARAEEALDPALTCRADLLRLVGPAPTARLQAAQRVFARACTHLERFGNAVVLASSQRVNDHARRVQHEASLGSAMLLEADQMLPPGEVRALPVIGGESTTSRTEPRFGWITSAIAEKNVEVRCWSAADWSRLIREEETYTQGQLGSDTLGFAGISGDRVNLAPDTCESLVALAYEGARPTNETDRLLLAAAVVTLTHEPQHSMGVADEAVAECNAIQLAHRTAARLGASRAYAAQLVRTYWRYYGQELPAYRSSECRDGGLLDRDYPGSIWP